MAKGSQKKRTSAKNKKADTGAPQTLTAKGGLSQTAFLKEVLFTMEDELRISNKQAKDFMDSLVAVTERELGDGNPVNLAGLVKLSPRLRTKGERMVASVFGDPTSPKVKKKYPAKVTIKATVMKKAKDALSSPQALAKKLG